MAKKSVLLGSIAFLASAGMLAIGCSDKNEYGSKDPAKNSLSQDQMPAMPRASGIGNYPDTQGSTMHPGTTMHSGTGYYDSSHSGMAGSSMDTASGRRTDSMRINSLPDTSTPATGPGNPGGSGGSGSGGSGTGGTGSSGF